jgi:hypothetical protein
MVEQSSMVTEKPVAMAVGFPVTIDDSGYTIRATKTTARTGSMLQSESLCNEDSTQMTPQECSSRRKARMKNKMEISVRE